MGASGARKPVRRTNNVTISLVVCEIGAYLCYMKRLVVCGLLPAGNPQFSVTIYIPARVQEHDTMISARTLP